MSSDEVITLYKDYKNTKDIGKLAIALAKYTYFRSNVMAQSTVTGRGGTTPLDPVKLQHLQSNIRAIFPLVDDAEFNRIGISARFPLQDVARLYDLWLHT